MVSTDNVKSADRVLRILEFLSSTNEGVPAAVIARALDIPLSSCLGLLGTMHNHKFVSLEEGCKKYLLSGKLRRIATAVDTPRNPLEDVAIRCARQLNRQLGDPVAVSRRVGLLVEWVFTVGRTHLQPGSTMPIFKSFNGMTAVLHLSETQLAALVEEYNEKFGRSLAIAPAEALKRIEPYRGRDYAAGGAPNFPGVAYICFRLTDDQTDEEILLTVRMPGSDLRHREPIVVKAVRDCGSQHLAYAS